MKAASGAAPAFAVALAALAGDAGAELPIYIEDDHAGSFHFLASTLDLDEPHTLLLVDAHSDASPVSDSDSVRDAIRRVASAAERGRLLESWRRSGKIQAYNWIEPLMPRPFAEVFWWQPAADAPGGAVRHARHLIDADLAFDPRRDGELAPRFHPLDGGATLDLPGSQPVVASIDLDAFAGMPAGEAGRALAEIWGQIITLPDLRAVTFSISRPWLADAAQAHALLEEALGLALAVRGAELNFEPFAPRGPDRSERAREFFAKGEAPPRYDLTTAPAGLRTLLLAHRDRVGVAFEPERWEAVLQAWEADLGGWCISIDGCQPSTDGRWRPDKPRPLRVRSHPPRPVPQAVRWLALTSDRDVYNILPEIPAGKQFASASPPLIREVASVLATTEDGALPASAWAALLDPELGAGAVRIAAEVFADGRWARTPAIEIRVAAGTGSPFRDALSEQFSQPYIFGAAFLSSGGETGPETGFGSDCATFLIAAWRRCGHRIRWGDPASLARALDTVDRGLTGASRPAIGRAEIDRGLAVRCGKHIAAVWEDRPPLGVLDPGDRVAHHLSGPPELITLGELLASRPDPRYDLLALPSPQVAFRIMVGGDICLSHEAERSDFERSLPPGVAAADLVFANLECSLTEHKSAARPKPFLFRGPPGRAAWLAEAGFDAMSLANNHSGDFGEVGREETRAALDRAGVAPFDARGIRLPVAGRSATCIGINLVEAEDVDAAVLSVATEIGHAKRRGDLVLVFPHWGEEYTAEVTERQRRLARGWIAGGADAILGSGPHHPQFRDHYRGRPIFYSLGNAYFPGAAGPAGFHDAVWAQLGLTESGRLAGSALLSAPRRPGLSVPTRRDANEDLRYGPRP